ncbi:MAG TPA: acetyl-CoA carboxylase carboxyltransferase subunit alpha [Ktedonobacterales bacterium]|nr:acetyl-CoA carboxylase carboxyltransferase subunit alpha [Ktedonobacterales bacterium]
MSFDLDFERPLAKLDEQIQGLSRRGDRLTSDQLRQKAALEAELEHQTDAIYGHLTPWQRVQVSRHRQRPHTADYVKSAFDEFFELRGDRRYADDRSILAGLASLDGRTVMLIGHEKGRDTKARQECNFGCPHPEGYRKAQRLMLQAERLRMPVITLIDTQGAFPGLEDEERGQAQAIAENLLVMARLRTPIVCAVIGEGGSGGALAIGVGDRLLMQRNAYYTVAAPEAAASILWRDANKAPEAAAAMKIGAPDLLQYGLVDRIVEEPRGGAHRDWRAASDLLRAALVEEVSALAAVPLDDLVAQRDAKLRGFGAFSREPALVR